MAKHNYVTELPADAVQLMYSGVELFVTPRGDVFRKGKGNQWLRVAWVHHNKHGHASIKVKTNQSHAYVHRLVALAFLPNLDNHPCVCHKSEALDSNGFLDNSVANLFWATQQDNMTDKTKKGRQPKGSLHGRSKLTETDISKIRQLHAAGKMQKTIAEIYGVSQMTISLIITGKRWTHI